MKETTKMQVGDHLVVRRLGYTHHGLYAGKGTVVHYSGTLTEKRHACVEETTLKDFSKGAKIGVREHPNRTYCPKRSVERARARIGEDNYSLFGNNCEHFVNYCIEGKQRSQQVDVAAGISTKAIATAAGMGAKGAVAASGSVAGLSGSGVMSGLASVGGVVGGGAVAGLGVLGGASGIAGAALLNSTVLADNEALDDEERGARSVGRKASYVGAAAGATSGVAAVSAAGTTAGLSAAGITSGLAAIGGTVGGGMAAGVAVTAAAPVAAAGAVGYGVYKFFQWLND